MPQRVAMLLDHAGDYDDRIAREKDALVDAGYRVGVFCVNRAEVQDPNVRGDEAYVQCTYDEGDTIPLLSRLVRRFRNNSPAGKKVSGIEAECEPAPPLRAQPDGIHLFKRILGTLFSFRANYKTVAASVNAFQPHIVHAHDLSMLPAGVRLARQNRAKLVYDSHEYERSRNLPLTKFEAWFRCGVEARAIRKADCVIAVSDSIADALARNYVIARPVVILNVSLDSLGQHGPGAMKAERQIPEAARAGVYVGALLRGRGLMTAVDCLERLPDLHLAVIGSDPIGYAAALRVRAVQRGVSERLHIFPPVPASQITAFMRGFDFSLLTIKGSFLSYEYALPNKLFQSLGAGLPVVATPLREISMFLDANGGGVVSRSHSAEDIAEAIDRVTAEKAPTITRPVRQEALGAYRWAVSEARLLEVYDALVAGRSVPEFAPFPHYRPDAQTRIGGEAAVRG